MLPKMLSRCYWVTNVTCPIVGLCQKSGARKSQWTTAFASWKLRPRQTLTSTEPSMNWQRLFWTRFTWGFDLKLYKFIWLDAWKEFNRWPSASPTIASERRIFRKNGLLLPLTTLLTRTDRVWRALSFQIPLKQARWIILCKACIIPSNKITHPH